METITPKVIAEFDAIDVVGWAEVPHLSGKRRIL